jgi:hypothetical protein
LTVSEQSEEEQLQKDIGIYHMNLDWNKLPNWTKQLDLCAVSKISKYMFHHRCRSPESWLEILVSPTHLVNLRKMKVKMSSEKLNVTKLSLDHATSSSNRCTVKSFSERMSTCPSLEEK